MARNYAPVGLDIRKAILMSGVTTLMASQQEIPGWSDEGRLLAPVFAVEIAKEGKKRGDTDEAVALEIRTARDDGTLQHASEFFDEMAKDETDEKPSATLARGWKGGR